ncbi:hypothetical protein WMY93_006364 [Mugilogobius chulae]|uniref:heme oxygenase (biliverdin-producing) n=1 Tax=Mugilogobius chulae TaxID=88201 RepID=A0AAW0PMV1_9GOBI
MLSFFHSEHVMLSLLLFPISVHRGRRLEYHKKERLLFGHKAQVVRNTETEELSKPVGTALELENMGTDQTLLSSTEPITERDLSEQIKRATKDSHVRAENTELMLSFQRAQVTLPQYKLLLSSLYEIYNALEEQMDKNCEHPKVAPIYFPSELARLKSIEKDLTYFYGPAWREKIEVPAATKRYTHRLRQIGKENPELLVAHAYTRYLGDLSGVRCLVELHRSQWGFLKVSLSLPFLTYPAQTCLNSCTAVG